MSITKHNLININNLFNDVDENIEIDENDQFLKINNITCMPYNYFIKKKKQYENKDLVICRICGFVGKHLMTHLSRKHNLLMKDYQQIFNITKEECFSKHYLKILSDNNKGEKNPAYQHGGRLSPFSKKFIKYKNLNDDEKNIKINECISKVSTSLKENQNMPSQIGYWLKRGYTYDEGKKQVSKSQTTFSLDKCIEKYGDIEGLKRWERRQLKWQNTLKSKPQEEIDRINKSTAVTEETFIKKYGEEKGKRLYKKYIDYIVNNLINNTSCFSKISQELFNSIFKRLDDNLKKECFFAKHNKEVHIKDENNNKRYYLDFVIKNVCIEFNGSYWHADKRFYNENSLIKEQKASDIWEQDNIKNNFIRKKYKLLIVWEHDYIYNKKQIINDCVKFIKENINE